MMSPGYVVPNNYDSLEDSLDTNYEPIVQKKNHESLKDSIDA